MTKRERIVTRSTRRTTQAGLGPVKEDNVVMRRKYSFSRPNQAGHPSSPTFLRARYWIASLCVATSTIFVGPSIAQAERKSVLDGAPAVRSRALLVRGRLELTPAFEATINADYRHTISGGLKAEYHLSDMFSFGAVGFWGTGINTGLVDKTIATLPETPTAGNLTPSADQYQQHLNDILFHGAAYVTFTPWYGKLAAFSRAFVHFDFYFSAGLAFAKLTNDCDTDTICTDPAPGISDPGNGVVADENPNNDPGLNDGTRFGVYLGGGIHVFLNDYIALDLTVRDYIFSDNPSGLDFNADLAVTDDDPRFLNHLFMGVGISFFLPMTPKRTR